MAMLLAFVLWVFLAANAQAQAHNLVTTRGVQEDGSAAAPSQEFNSGEPVYLSVIVDNLSVGTRVTASWYLDPGERWGREVAKYTWTSDRQGSSYVYFYQNPPWTPGRYGVYVEVDGLNTEGDLPAAFFQVYSDSENE